MATDLAGELRRVAERLERRASLVRPGTTTTITPFLEDDAARLMRQAAAVVERQERVQRYDPDLIGEMVRWYRKMGHPIPEGQPRTSQEGAEMARLANAALAQEPCP